MREKRFSAGAERVLRSAQAAALELGHGYVGCEHLLLGMLREEEDAPARALRASGVEEKKTRELITRAVGRGDADLAPSQGLTPHARCAVEMAVTEAERSGQPRDRVGASAARNAARRREHGRAGCCTARVWIRTGSMETPCAR